MECMICLEKNNATINMNSCGCKLNIHKRCYNEWNNSHKGQCPLCRNTSPIEFIIPVQRSTISFRKKLYIIGITCACVILMFIMII